MSLIKISLMIGRKRILYSASVKMNSETTKGPGLITTFESYFSTANKMSAKELIGISEENIKAELIGIELSKKIFMHGVNSVLPQNLIRNQVRLNGSLLDIKQTLTLDLNSYENINVVGFGKAVLPMAEEICKILGPRITKCVLSTPLGTRTSSDTRIDIFRGAKNNIPDPEAYKAAEAIVKVVSETMKNDLLIVLISGGGSALLPYPRPPVTLEEKSGLIKKLSLKGANIVELNTIRKKLSLVKGGGLVQLCQAKSMISLILSDVLGDELDIIASGPTVYVPEEPGKALKIAHKYLLPSEIPENILFLLKKTTETQNRTEGRAENIIIGNNNIALFAAATLASQKYSSLPVVLTSTLEGNARYVGEQIARVCHLISQKLTHKNEIQDGSVVSILKDLNISSHAIENLQRSIETAQQTGSSLCLLFGGETIVRVSGKGIGGRNQELALSAALTLKELKSCEKITIFSGGTDGIDGPCDAAGAIISPLTLLYAEHENLDAQYFLSNNDSYTFFKSLDQGKYHVITGHTGTNVMDMVIALVNLNSIIPRTSSSL